MIRYFFKTEGFEPDIDCIEPCPVLNNRTMIGSVACQQCPNCIDKDDNPYECNWIVCDKLNEIKKGAV